MLAAVFALFLLGQTPSTSTVIVVISDQTGAAVPDATVKVANEQTSDMREVVSGQAGTASFPALSLTGTYAITVSKQGFGTEERKGVALRAGETATIRVKLAIGVEKADV